MTNPGEELRNLPNIGMALAEKLILAGIKDACELKNAGAENVFIKLKTIDKDACINMLFAIEGAIQGIRWHRLDDFRKWELVKFFKLIIKQQL